MNAWAVVLDLNRQKCLLNLDQRGGEGNIQSEGAGTSSSCLWLCVLMGGSPAVLRASLLADVLVLLTSGKPCGVSFCSVSDAHGHHHH